MLWLSVFFIWADSFSFWTQAGLKAELAMSRQKSRVHSRSATRGSWKPPEPRELDASRVDPWHGGYFRLKTQLMSPVCGRNMACEAQLVGVGWGGEKSWENKKQDSRDPGPGQQAAQAAPVNVSERLVAGAGDWWGSGLLFESRPAASTGEAAHNAGLSWDKCQGSGQVQRQLPVS